MALTPEQLSKHHLSIGGSDVAAILGVSPYSNAYDVWMAKKQMVAPLQENEAMYAGTKFEPGILSFAQDELGPLETDDTKLEFLWPGFPVVDHPDAIVIENGEPVEAKTAGLLGPLPEDVWGEPWTDQVPDSHIVQCHVHMGATDKDVCHLAAFLGGRGFVMYRIEKDPVIFDTIQDAIIDFWEHVENDTPPPNVMPTLPFSKRVIRVPRKIVNLPIELVEHWLNSKESLKTAEQMKDAAQAEILAKLGDAEAGVCIDSSGRIVPLPGIVTYYEQTARRIDAERLRKENPDIAEEFTNETTSRVLRIKKPKKTKGIK